MLRTEYVDVDFNLKLQKDLQEDEVICPHCGGTGLQIDDAPFGLRKEGERHSYPLFPYKKQTIISCQHCYNGVQKKCLHCGQILNRMKYQCDCEGTRLERRQKQYKKDLEVWNKAEKIPFKEALNKFVMVYIDNDDEFIMADELEDWINDKKCEKEFNKNDLRIYGTYATELSIDAYDILENATSDLHENAMDNIENIDKLQEFLNKWCEENKQGTTTYYADFKIGIQL